MIDNANPQELINLLRTFIGDKQIVRAAREAADVIERQAARIATLDALLVRVAQLKRYDANRKSSGQYPVYRYTLNMPVHLMEEIDAAIAASAEKGDKA